MIPFVKQDFRLVILVIILISILPALFEYLKHRSEAQRAKAA